MKNRSFGKLLMIAALVVLLGQTACENLLVSRVVDMPPVTNKQIIIEKNVMVAMRDGVKLATDIYRPAGEGKYPVILIRIPYNKEEMLPLFGKQVAKRGYILITQDCRGTFASEGRVFFPLFREADDGNDAIDWITKQAWYDGGIAMAGGSYFGYTQWAVSDNKNLKCFYPLLTSPNIRDVFMVGGALQYEITSTWTNTTGKQNEGVNEKDMEPDPNGGWYNMPLKPVLVFDLKELAYNIENKDIVKKLLGIDLAIPPTGPVPPESARRMTETLLPLFSYPELSKNQKAMVFGDAYQDVAAPMYSVAGWYDIFLKTQIDDFNKVRAEAKSEDVRKYSKLVIGPWAHGISNGMASDNSANANDRAMINTFLNVQWFGRWLKGDQNGIENTAPVKIYVMGANVWRDEQEWPPARMTPKKYYLHSDGRANSMYGNGTLSLEAPKAYETPDAFVFDPANPVPTRGGALLSGKLSGMKLQNDVEERFDVLVYTLPTLEEDLELTGPIKAVIYASTTAVDTDWTAKLVDVRPDGKIVNIQDGIIRARYRDGYDKPSLLYPNKTYQYTIDMWATSYLFKKGHTIRIEISSSNFPRFERNCGLGGYGDAKKYVIAHQMVFHDQEHPSYIELPVMPVTFF